MVPALAAFHIAVLLAAAAVLIAAAFNDAHRYKIPNILCAAMLLLFPLFVITSPRSVEWEQHLMVFGLVLISGFAMFIGNLAGAGDIKLMAAMGLWAGPHLVSVFLIMTAIAGGILALVMAILTYIRNHSGKQALQLAKVPIPYGIAIAVGGLSTIYMLSQPILFPS
ncbi:MAG TPA: prepilin peptidase [Alphaproteobacteria bacterium]|nr:prepilin peptidase [Alphaproteobacteria bacterium]